jgi:NAD+ synthase (glutamine-hydrolysing)
MPYSILDEIERMAIIGKKSPLDIFQELCDDSRDPLQVAKWVDRFFRLWCRNQWKRERYAPSFHVDNENLDPKSWCRFPILSGGFELELERMWSTARAVAK